MSTERTAARAPSPHSPAAFINSIYEEGTKAEAIKWLQLTWNDYVSACKQRDALVPAMEAGLFGLRHMESLYRTYASGARKRGNPALEAKHAATAAGYARQVEQVEAALSAAKVTP